MCPDRRFPRSVTSSAAGVELAEGRLDRPSPGAKTPIGAVNPAAVHGNADDADLHHSSLAGDCELGRVHAATERVVPDPEGCREQEI